jgi:hypothetical protein
MAKSKFTVSPPAQHEFRILGGTRPNGSEALVREALEAAHQQQLERDRRRVERTQERAKKAEAGSPRPRAD